MSLQEAELFVEKMKSDKDFSQRIFSLKSLSQRVDMANAEGFDFTLEDIQALRSTSIDPKIEKSNLPLSWQCKGPCHNKCSDIVA